VVEKLKKVKKKLASHFTVFVVAECD